MYRTQCLNCDQLWMALIGFIGVCVCVCVVYVQYALCHECNETVGFTHQSFMPSYQSIDCFSAPIYRLYINVNYTFGKNCG